MNEILEHYKKNHLHHFYILVGEKKSLCDDLKKLCFEKIGASKDLFFEYEFDRFLLENAKDLIQKSLIKIPKQKKKVFCIYLNSATREAQNALLKSIEEPTPGTHFFFIVLHEKVLLETVLSRGIILKIKNEFLSEKDREQIEKLLKLSLAKKIVWADKFSKDISDEKKSKSDAKIFLRKIMMFMEEELLKNNKKANVIKKLQKIDNYFNDQGSSTKILLERVAMLI